VSEVVAAHGEGIVAHVEANLHWDAFHFLGRLLAIVYVLNRTADDA
jgi:hypothetical protein